MAIPIGHRDRVRVEVEVRPFAIFRVGCITDHLVEGVVIDDGLHAVTAYQSDARAHTQYSCASFHLAVRTNPRVVQALLGHSSVGITLATYSHLLPEVQEEAARKINQIFD